MDYEKKYKEAIERAKEIIECSKSDTKEVRMVLSFFPELAESEDERIRKDIISYLKSSTALSPKTWIEWLEKQGEQKSTDKVELMPTWSKEDERDFDVIYGIIYNSCNAEDASRLIEWLNSLKDRVQSQPKQEWSNWDKTIIESIEALCDEKIESVVFQDVKEHVNDIKDWLKSIRPQSTWKPSDEEMKALEFCLEHNIDKDGIFGSKVVKLYDELKKLKG